MTIFELITLTLSIVLGLSMSHLLWSAMALVRARRETHLHWLPLAWAAVVFLAQVQYWFAAMSVDAVIDSWTWAWYLHMLFQALLLFSSSALVLPSESQRGSGALLDDFNEDGRLGLIPFGAYFLLWIPTNHALDGAWFHGGNVANVVIASAAAVGFVWKGRGPQAAAVLVALGTFVWGMLFQWAELTMTP